MPAIGFGILASLAIGVSDAFGRSSALRAAAISHVNTQMLVGVFIATPVAIAIPGSPIGADLLAGVASGVILGVGLALVYRAMADSSSAVAAPLAAVLAALIPLAWDLLGGATITTLAAVGSAVAIASIGLTTFNPSLEGQIGRGVALALVGGFMFGVSIVLVADTSSASGAWPAAAQRVAGFVATALVAKGARIPVFLPKGVLKFGVWGGVAGGLGMVFWVLGAQKGDLGTISVAASTYPTVTVLLSTVFDGDQLRWWQIVGVGGAVLGTALIALG